MTKLVYNQMDEFELDEISSVDVPAQTPAKALLMKAGENPELLKRFKLLSDADGHSHLIDLGDEAGHTSHDMADGAEFGHSHPYVKNSDGSVSVGMADGHTHTVVEKRLTVEDLSELAGESLEPAGSGGGQEIGEIQMTKTDEKTAGADEAVNKRIEELEGKLAKASALASLNDVQKAHYGTLSPEAQEQFLGASDDERQARVEKAQGEDPVVYTTLDGQDIRKSAGSVVLSLAKRADEAEKNLAIEKASREREALAKRAQEELGHLPGDESVQVALLKAVEGIPSESDRKGALEILKAANDGVEKAFETAGTISGEEGDAEAKLEKMASERSNQTGESFAKAYKAVLESKEGRELFKQSRS
jgi:hypothetical protein